METFEEGDIVFHEPSGEEWILLMAKDGYVYPAGWPRCRVPAKYCRLIRKDDGTLDRLRGVQPVK